MIITQEMVPDILEKIAEGVHNPNSAAQGAAYQLERIANALERIADALEPNRKAWTTNKEDEMNLHSMVYAIMTDRQRDQSKPSRSRYGNYQ